MKVKGKSKFPPTVEEQQAIVTLTASGQSQNRISKTIGRSRHLVQSVLDKPEIQHAIQDERQELAIICRDKARAIFLSINNADIEKANLLQKATSGAIMLDKALLLSGEATSINVSVLLEVAHAIRDRERGRVVLPLPSARTAPA